MFIFNSGSCRATLIAALSALLLVSTQTFADDFDSTWYLGAGLGTARFDFDTPAGVGISDKKDNGYRLFGGYDISRLFSVEAFYTELGTAKLSPSGEVDFSAYGASALWYFWRNQRNYSMRQGWQAYLLAGVSSMDASSNVTFSPGDGAQLHYGAALEYGWRNGFAVRAGLDGYDTDTAVATLSLLKRFGKSRAAVEPKAAEPVEAAPAEAAVAAPVVVQPSDGDNDGVIDSADKCPETRAGAPVDADGCEITQVVLEGVNFELNSAELTSTSFVKLDEAVAALKKYPDLRVEVQAHTDNSGEAAYNQYLSDQRAKTVRDYLVSQGIAADRLEAKGYGETAPMADNATREGRAQNRRVELKVIE